MKKIELTKIIKEEITKVLERSQHDIFFKPLFDVDHYIDFKNPRDAESKLRGEGIDFDLNEDGEFIFPKMSYKTWYWIKELFVQEDIRGIGQY